MQIIEADWPAPQGVKACVTTRLEGASQPPYDAFNLALHVEENPAVVEQNRATLLQGVAGCERIQWLQQVHSTKVITAPVEGSEPEADASVTREPGLGLAVLTADCLPVLLCNRTGTCIAAAHAGWRGLVNGVLENTVAAMRCSDDLNDGLSDDAK